MKTKNSLRFALCISGLFAVFSKSAFAVDYTNNNLSTVLNDNTVYENVVITAGGVINSTSAASAISLTNITSSASLTNGFALSSGDGTTANIKTVNLSGSSANNRINTTITNNNGGIEAIGYTQVDFNLVFGAETSGTAIYNSNSRTLNLTNNGGSISSSVALESTAIYSDSSVSSTITNNNGGQINASGKDATAISLNGNGSVNIENNNSQNNPNIHGVIQATNGEATGGSAKAIYINSTSSSTITNNGEIRASDTMGGSAIGISAVGSGTINIYNNGTINAEVTSNNQPDDGAYSIKSENSSARVNLSITENSQIIGTVKSEYAGRNNLNIAKTQSTLTSLTSFNSSSDSVTLEGTWNYNVSDNTILQINNNENLQGNSNSTRYIGINGGTVYNSGSLGLRAGISSGSLINSGTFSFFGGTMSGGTLDNAGTIDGDIAISGGAFTNRGNINDNISQTGGTVTNGINTSSTNRTIHVINQINSSSGAITNYDQINNLYLGGNATILNESFGTNNGNIAVIKNAYLTSGTATNEGTIENVASATGGTITNTGSSALITAANINGATLQINGGSATTVNFSSGTVNSGASGTITRLNLIANTALGNIGNNGTISNLSNGTDGTANITYDKILSGSGSINKIGTGRLEITGTSNSHSGTFSVAAGELKVNGLTRSQVQANSGATISGTGTIGTLTVNSGGILASGNSIGTLNVLGTSNGATNGTVALNSGSISNFEFDRSTIDKTIASGNITIANGSIANFNLYNASGYFVVAQNILETTDGTVSGQFSSVNTDNGYVTDLQYNPQNVHAVIAKKIDSNAIDGTLSAQNSVGRILSKTISDKLLNLKDVDDEEPKMWISTGGFNNRRQEVANSSTHSSSGIITSAGIAKNFDSIQLIGGLFNSRANVARYTFSGDDEVETNGVLIGAGKNFTSDFGDFYLLAQAGVGIYNLHNNRQVAVNNNLQNARGKGTGNIQYVGLTSSYELPIDNLSGSFEINTSVRLQKTYSGGWQENGLDAGNLNFSKSHANTINYEISTAYKNDFAPIFHLPKDSFYKVEASGYKSSLFSSKSATVRMGSAHYNLTPHYEERLLVGVNGFVSIPVLKSTKFVADFGKRQNGRYKEISGNVGFEVSF